MRCSLNQTPRAFIAFTAVWQRYALLKRVLSISNHYPYGRIVQVNFQADTTSPVVQTSGYFRKDNRRLDGIVLVYEVHFRTLLNDSLSGTFAGASQQSGLQSVGGLYADQSGRTEHLTR